MAHVTAADIAGGIVIVIASLVVWAAWHQSPPKDEEPDYLDDEWWKGL